MKSRQILALALCLSLCCPCAIAAEEATVPFWRSTGKRVEMRLDWPESAFFQPAGTYDHGLARMSLAMSLAAFGGRPDAPSAMIADFFAALDFSAPQVAQYDTAGADTIGTAIAHRTLQSGADTVTLVAVAIRGGNYGDEWLSNFACGADESYHAGFAQAARTVAARAAAYVREKDIAHPRFWLAGYSRGAAVANLTAGFIQEMGLAEDADIFAYTFATPRTVRGELTGRHANVINILNEADIVTQVPLAAWGFGRFGQDLCLPVGEEAQGLLPDVRAAYRQYMDGEMAEENGDLALQITSGAVTGLSLAVQNPEKYAAGYQALMSKAFTGQALSGSEMVQLGALLMMMNNGILRETGRTASLKTNLQSLQDAFAAMNPIFQQHVPERYLAWMMTMPDGGQLRMP